MKKIPGDILILHMCTINDNHMIYVYSDMEIFPNNTKNQNFEKKKKTPGAIIILHKCAKNHDHILHCS